MANAPWRSLVCDGSRSPYRAWRDQTPYSRIAPNEQFGEVSAFVRRGTTPGSAGAQLGDAGG